MALVQGDEVLVGLDHAGIGVPVDLGIVEEVDLARVADLLAAVDEDAAVDEGRGHEGGEGAVVAEEFPDGRLLDMLVVVGGEAELDLAGGETGIFAGISGEQGADRNAAGDGAGPHLRLLRALGILALAILTLALGILALRALAAAEAADGLLDGLGHAGEDAAEGGEPAPGVVQVEAGLEVVLALALGEHQQVMAGAAQLGDAVLPEREGDIVGRIAAETVHADLDDPELHGVDHGLAELRVVEIQVRDVVPAGTGRMDDIAILIMGVPLRMFLDPGIVPGGDEGLEVFQGAEFRIDGLVILDAIRALDGFLDPDLADGHEPYDIGTQVLDGIQPGVNGLEGLLGCEVAGIDLIHDYILRRGNGDRNRPGRASGCQDGE